MAVKADTQIIRRRACLSMLLPHTEVKRLTADAEARVKTLGRPGSGMGHAGSYGRKFEA